MAREEYDVDSASSQFFWLLFDSDLTPAGKNYLDGRYSCFGYTVKGARFLSDVKVICVCAPNPHLPLPVCGSPCTSAGCVGQEGDLIVSAEEPGSAREESLRRELPPSAVVRLPSRRDGVGWADCIDVYDQKMQPGVLARSGYSVINDTSAVLLTAAGHTQSVGLTGCGRASSAARKRSILSSFFLFVLLLID